MGSLISIPCWGEYHIGTCIKYALPALRAALAYSNTDYRLIIHTNEADLLKPHIGDLSVAFKPIIKKKQKVDCVGPTKDVTDHVYYGNCHREVIDLARPGECVMLMNADIVVSREVFVAAEARFRQGKKLVVCTASRCLLKPPETPPIGAPARKLLEWTIGVLHPSVAACFWGIG